MGTSQRRRVLSVSSRVQLLWFGVVGPCAVRLHCATKCFAPNPSARFCRSCTNRITIALLIYLAPRF